MLDEAFSMKESKDDDENEEAAEMKEKITSVNSVILCDSIESAIEISYKDLNSERIAEATQRHLEVCLDQEAAML